jgi:glycosyltransferase involved in cell wall biosynthesis
VSPSFHPTAAYGGTIRSSYGLCRGLVSLGCQVRVLTTDTDGIGRNLDVPNNQDLDVDGLQVRYCHKVFRHSISVGLLRSLGRYIAWADVVHLIAVYSFPTFPTMAYCRRLQKPLVWSPRGSLQRWEGSTRMPAKFLWEQACRILAAKERLILHTTSEEEARQSQIRFPGVRTVIVRNGVELPADVRRIEPSRGLRITYLGRLHAIKGIENLLEACKLMAGDSDPWHLKIAGTGQADYFESLKLIVQKLELDARVEFLGEVSGQGKQDLFANSDVVVAPSHVENFGMVIAEALAHAVPVIAGKGTPWRGLQTNGCGLWVDNDPQSLSAAMRHMRDLPLRDMGRRGRRWMEREFSWDRISSEMLQLFRDSVASNAY